MPFLPLAIGSRSRYLRDGADAEMPFAIVRAGDPDGFRSRRSVRVQRLVVFRQWETLTIVFATCWSVAANCRARSQ